jgi:50S ribosomal subunit-associated GTPase HflX
VPISALTGHGLGAVRTALASLLQLRQKSVELRFARTDVGAIAGLYSVGRVVSHEVHDGVVRIVAEIPERLLERYREYLS